MDDTESIYIFASGEESNVTVPLERPKENGL